MAFITAVADIRCPCEPAAMLFFEVFAVLVAAGARSALDVTEFDLIADIGMLAMKPLCTEVMCIKEEPFSGVVFRKAVLKDLF